MISFCIKKPIGKCMGEFSESVFSDVTVNVENPLATYTEFCDRLDTLKQMVIPRFTKDVPFVTKLQLHGGMTIVSKV